MALHDDDTGRGTSLETVLSDLKRGKSVPCYLLYGDEEFRLQEAVEKITTSLIPKSHDRELNLFVTDGEHEDVGSLCESLSTPPLFPGRKVLVVRDTRLFQSKYLLAPLIAKIRESIKEDPDRAAASFMQFLSMTELQLDDLKEGGWRQIDDDTWQKIVPDDDSEDRETWLPMVVDLCVSRGLLPVKEKEDETDQLERVLSGGMPEKNHLILTAETVDRRKRIFKAISKVGKVLSFAKITGEGKLKDKKRKESIQEMVEDLLTKVGKRISDDAWSVVGEKTGFDLRESMAAIEKLITYVGEKKVIEAADVEDVIGRTKEESVFNLTRAIDERDLIVALRSLHDFLDQGVEPRRIFRLLSMIIREIRILLRAKLLITSGRLGNFNPGMDFGRFQNTVYPALTKISGDDGMEALSLIPKSPFPAYQTLTNAGRFSQEELTNYLEMLLRIDVALKSTGQNPRLLLERFLIAVCKRLEVDSGG